MSESCWTCRFWRNPRDVESIKQLGEQRIKIPFQIGDCRRKAPDNSGRGRAEWPRTEDFDWCGEFEPSAGNREAADVTDQE